MVIYFILFDQFECFGKIDRLKMIFLLDITPDNKLATKEVVRTSNETFGLFKQKNCI